MEYEVSGYPAFLKLKLFEEAVCVREERVIYKTERVIASDSRLEGSGEAGVFSQGRIKMLRLEEGDSVLVCEDAWLAYESLIIKEHASPNLSRFGGPGILFLEAGGSFLDFMLEEEENLHVHNENLVAIDATVNHEAKDGFMHLRGPGAVMVQTNRGLGEKKEKKEESENVFGNIFGTD